MARQSTTKSWLFPPRSCEVQLDEKWSFVGKKEHNCDKSNPADADKGDRWDHTAIDAESRLLLAVVPGERTLENCQAIVQEVHDRTGGRTDLLLTSDEHKPYATAIESVYAREEPVPRRPGPGRPPKPKRVMPADLCYATVCKKRREGKVVEVTRRLVTGMLLVLCYWLARSKVSGKVNTAFVERHNATDRRQNARKHRKTYAFSKDSRIHDAVTYFTCYSYNFCWPVRTLASKDELGRKRPRTPAMAAGLTDHVWSLHEWLSFPANPCLLR
jgi:IS1 family transposase